MKNAIIGSMKLSFLRGRRIFLVESAEIIRMEAKDNYTCVHFSNHSQVLMAKVLRIYDELLSPYGFVRTHRSHLINLRYVDSLDLKGIIYMSDASSVKISRSKKKEVYRTILNPYCKNRSL